MPNQLAYGRFFVVQTSDIPKAAAENQDVRSYLSDLVDEERSSRNVAGREMYGSMGMPHGHGHEGHEGHGGPEYPPPEDAPDIEVPPPPEEF